MIGLAVLRPIKQRECAVLGVAQASLSSRMHVSNMGFSRLALLTFFSASALANTGTPTVTIDAGVVVGKATTLPNALGPVNQFLGVPFAQSPPERFSPPRAPSEFDEPIDATAWKPSCIQQFRCTC